MGKQKRSSSFKKSSIDLLLVVFKHLISLHNGREKFALTWIWNEPRALDVFVELVLGKEKVSKDSLINGYRDCRRENYAAFDEGTWAKIDELFLKKRLFSQLPGPIRSLLRVLKTNSQEELLELMLKHEETMMCNTSYSQAWKEVRIVSEKELKTMQGNFLEEWTIPAKEIFQPELAKVCRVFPPACVFAETKENLTYFFERMGSDVSIIAMHFKNALEPSAMDYMMRSLLEELFARHPKILRWSMATLDSHMTGFRPFWQRHELEGGSKVSFYTHLKKLRDVLKNLSSAREFEGLVDRYAHAHLSELILALFMWKLPLLVDSFFKFSKPYLNAEDYDMSNMESSIGGCGPCAYQLYITKDFCSEIHRDVDASNFTLSYCSHPDATSSTPVQFIMAKHGFRIGIENGSLFGFDSSRAHGTAYRNRTHNIAYMGCLMVNSALYALTRRRQLL